MNNSKFTNSEHKYISIDEKSYSEEEFKKLYELYNELQEDLLIEQDASKEELKNTIQKVLIKNGISPKKIPEPYASFIENINNASKEELKRLSDAIRKGRNTELAYEFVNDNHKNVSLDIDTNNEEEGRKR